MTTCNYNGQCNQMGECECQDGFDVGTKCSTCLPDHYGSSCTCKKHNLEEQLLISLQIVMRTLLAMDMDLALLMVALALPDITPPTAAPVITVTSTILCAIVCSCYHSYLIHFRPKYVRDPIATPRYSRGSRLLRNDSFLGCSSHLRIR